MAGAAASFCFDLASPHAYLAAERVIAVLPAAAEWQPVLARELPGAARAGAPTTASLRAEIELRAAELALPPVRWPDPFPFDSTLAMRAATYAGSIGRAVPFALAAFRQAFAGGRSLEDPDSVVIAAAACEMHPRAVLRAAELRSVAEQLARATARAAQVGVRELPAVVLQGDRGEAARVFTGERALERAAEQMGPRAR